MINSIYRLKSPRNFEIAFSDVSIDENIIVRPLRLSICRADQRYFQGTRDAKVLMNKLPMALIHEAMGEVVYPGNSNFLRGEKVVLIPNIPNETDDYIAENYLWSSKFAGSTSDGFLQEYVSLNQNRVVRLPDTINMDVASFIELISVSMHAISRMNTFSHQRRERIGVWGDGNLGFITSLIIHKLFPESKIAVFGVSEEKLSDFSFADETYLTTNVPKHLYVDHAFECVGGNGSPVAIDQIIDIIKPEGTISLLGVSEYPILINTRMILEKGIKLFGSSRSGKNDFQMTVNLLSHHPDVVEYLARLISNRVHINSFSDIKKAFELDAQKAFGKTILLWEI